MIEVTAAGEPAGSAVSIIVPVRNEEAAIKVMLADLRTRWPAAEQVVVDGDSTDGTRGVAAKLADRLVVSKPGRALQMNAGAAVADRSILLFLHADTHLPPNALDIVEGRCAGRSEVWGRFDVAIDGRHALLPLIATMMNRRSRLTGVATGDQAIFVAKAAFERVGGYPPIALMEDIALSKRLRRLSPPICLRERVVTSGRRWDGNGALRTIVLMWSLRLGYVAGVSPEKLAGFYARLKNR